MSAFYKTGREALINGTVRWVSDSIIAILTNNVLYQFNENNIYLSSIPKAARVGEPVQLQNRSRRVGAFSADNAMFKNVQGITIGGIVLAAEAEDLEKSLLLAYIDHVTGLPIKPNGNHIKVEWEPCYIFKIGELYGVA
jgi:hypothetical protein